MVNICTEVTREDIKALKEATGKEETKYALLGAVKYVIAHPIVEKL